MATSLPRGLVCDRGYLFIRIFPNNTREPYLEGCGPHSRATQRAATILLAKHREFIIFGKWDKSALAPSITVNEAIDIYLATKDFPSPSSRMGAHYVMKAGVRPYFGHMKFDQVEPMHGVAWREEQLKAGTIFSTVNRRQNAIQGVYTDLLLWVKQKKEGLPRFKVPAENPFRSVGKRSEKSLERKRVPSREEFKVAKAWCDANDPELWEIIVRAIVTFLRRSDLRAANASGQSEGIQGKTGNKFRVYAKFPKPVSLVNWRKRWEKLQVALGWNVEGTPAHTVWHDLRHCGPTILGEQGYSTKQIQQLTGHATEEMANKYTHLRPEKIQEAAAAVEKEMRAI